MTTVAVLSPVLGSNWSDALTVAVFVRGWGRVTVAWMQQRLGTADADRLHVQTPGRRVIRALARAWPTRRKGRGRSIDDTGRRGGDWAAVGQGDRVGDRLADVGRRIVRRLGRDEVGELQHLAAEAVLLAMIGSNWSAGVIVAVLVGGLGLATVARIVSVCSPRQDDRPRGPEAGALGRRSPGSPSP